MKHRLNDIDQARLLPRYRQPGTNTPLTKGNHSGSVDTPIGTRSSATTATAGELRGIPVQAKGVGGTQPHTNPEAETIYRLTKQQAA